MSKTVEEYKALSVKEFTEAAAIYEKKNAGIYNVCRMLRREEVQKGLEDAGMIVEKNEKEKGMRLHLVARKPL